MNGRHIISCAVSLALLGSLPLAAQNAPTDSSKILELRSVTVENKNITLRPEVKASLGPHPQNVAFFFGPDAAASRQPIRIRYKLEGYDRAWHQGDGYMFLAARFYNDAGDVIEQKIFTVNGDSAGWQGELQTSPLTHRRETLVVPAQASRLWIVISSAGPPATEGIYAVQNLVVSRISSNNASEVLLRSPADGQPLENSTNRLLSGWTRDGTHQSMAKMVALGQEPMTQALAILDDDPLCHAEWRNTADYAPKVAPGEHLSLDWSELFSMGVPNLNVARYDSLPEGDYQFRVAEVNLMGVPTGVEITLSVVVPRPLWQEPSFVALIFVIIIALAFMLSRYYSWQKMGAEMARLQNQRALEQERLRIAHDIHDDLGARVTQISLLSALAHDNPALPEKARADFDQISRMSRDLVSALYETVWAVNPDNDNLDALGNYLCQMVNQLCDRAQFRCRFHMQDLPVEVELSSQTRHNISMVVKEAVHNVIKHAKASEVTIRIAFNAGVLSVSVHDDGCGFNLAEATGGNGLANMQRRLRDIGGSCTVESAPGKGTTVHLRLLVKPV